MMTLAHKITCVYVIYHSPSIAEQLASYETQIIVYERGNNYCLRFKSLIHLHETCTYPSEVHPTGLTLILAL